MFDGMKSMQITVVDKCIPIFHCSYLRVLNCKIYIYVNRHVGPYSSHRCGPTQKTGCYGGCMSVDVGHDHQFSAL